MNNYTVRVYLKISGTQVIRKLENVPANDAREACQKARAFYGEFSKFIVGLAPENESDVSYVDTYQE